MEQVELAVCETKCTLTMLRLAGMIGGCKVRKSNMSRQTHLQSAARHELLDNVEAGGHALRGLGLHAPHPLELHYMPANRSHIMCLHVLGNTDVLPTDNPELRECEVTVTHWRYVKPG